MIDLSIIIINFNSENYIEKCLKSCIEQNTKFKYEIIIVDDASTDDSYKKIKHYKSKLVKVFKNKKNLGIEITANFGLRKSKGKYICRVDSDDLLEPKFIDIMIKNFKSKISFCYSNYKVINSSGKILSKKYLPNFDRQEILARGDFLATGTVYKRNIFEKFGYYNTRHKNCGLENFEFILNLIFMEKKRGLRINKFLFSLRKHSKNISKIKKKHIFNYGKKILKKFNLGEYTINQNHPNLV